MTEPEPSGPDLARRALAAAIKAARERPAEPRAARKTAGRPKRPAPHTGRDPVGLGAAVAGLLDDRGWQDPAAGADILTSWPEIAGRDVAGHVTATAFDADTGRLDVLPDSPTWAAHARLTAPQLIERANHAAGRRLVRQVHVLPPGHRGPAPPPEQTTAHAEPRRATGADPTPEYLRTRAALAQGRRRRPPAGPDPTSGTPTLGSLLREPPHIMADIINRIHGRPTPAEPAPGAPRMEHQPKAAPPRRHTASTVTDPDLEALYDQRDGLLRLLMLTVFAGTGTARTSHAATNDRHRHVADGEPALKAADA